MQYDFVSTTNSLFHESYNDISYSHFLTAYTGSKICEIIKIRRRIFENQ